MVTTTPLTLLMSVCSQLIEMKPEEAAKEKIKRKQEEKAKQREAINNLQNSVQELQAVIGQLGEELINQKKHVASLISVINSVQSENNALKKKIDDLTGDTLPSDITTTSTPVDVSSNTTATTPPGL